MKNKFPLYTLLLFSFILTSCQKADPNAEMVAKNKATMQQIMDAINANNPDALDKLIDANYVEHTPDPTMKGTGLQALKGAVTMWHQQFPDLKLTVNWIIAEGDKVMAHYTWTGTNTGSVEGMPATGKAVNVDGVDIAQFKDGIGMEHWGYFDMAKMMQQMGMMPSPGEMTPPGTPAPDGMKK